MANWYSKGQSQYTVGNFHMAFYMDMDGYPELDYDSQDIEGEGASGDPFMAFAIDTETWVYGQGQVEIGLLGSHRIRINSSGVRIWTDGDVWEDPLTGGGGDADAYHDNVDGEIHATTLKGTPADADELVIEDSVASWAKKRITISSLPSGGETNTMSNEGTGTGLFWQKDGVNFELNNLKSENDRISVSLDGVSHDIEFTLNEGNIVHNNLSGGTADDAHHPKSHALDSHSVPTGSIAMSTQKFTGLGAGSVAGDSVRYEQLHSQSHDNADHTTNYHTEADGTGVVTVHSDVTSVGSGAIITTNERNALHTIYSLESHNNTYHSTNYEVANANIQSHVASPVTDAHHARYTNGEAQSAVTFGDVDSGTDFNSHSEQVKAGFHITGGGTITVDGSYRVGWTQRMIVMNAGRGTHFSTTGFFQIDQPTSGVITAVGGGTANTWTASGIIISGWNSLYYILPIGSNNTSIPANFRMVGYTSDLEIPDDWILIAKKHHEGGAEHIKFGVGIQLNSSETWVQGTASMIKYTDANAVSAVLAADDYVKIVGDTMTGDLNMAHETLRFGTNGDIIHQRSSGGYLKIWGVDSITDNKYIECIDDGNLIIRGYHQLNLGTNQGGSITSLTLTPSTIFAHKPLTMNTNKITDLGDGSAAQDAMAFGQKYALEQHDNAYHSTNYKADFSENTAFNKDFGTAGTEVCVGNDARLSDDRNPTSHALDSHTIPSSSIAMNAQKFTGLAAGTVNGDSVRYEQLHAEDHDNAHHTTNYEAEFSKNTAFNKDFGTAGTEVCVGNDSRLSDARTPTVHNNTYHDPDYLANIVEDTTPQLGGDLDLNDHNIFMNIALTADGKHEGIIRYMTVDENTFGFGGLLHLQVDGHFDDASNSDIANMPCSAISVEAGTGARKVMFFGVIRDDTWHFTIGDPVIVGDNGTAISLAALDVGDYTQIVGIALTEDSMLFNPSLDYVKRKA